MNGSWAQHPSAPYNPLIVGAFFRAGYIEAWGRGIEKIDLECSAHGIDPPLYDSSMSGLMLAFQANAEHLIKGLGEAGVRRILEEKVGKKVGETRVKTQVETRVKTPDRIIELLRAHPRLTLVEVAARIGKSVSAVERATAKLTSEGRLRRVGPRKGGHWEVPK